MARELPPLFKTTERVIREIEEAVRRFPRFHKYSIGQRLRDQAYRVLELLHLAWRDRSQQLQHVRQLVLAIDVLKSTLQVAMQLGAYASAGQFEFDLHNDVHCRCADALWHGALLARQAVRS